MMRVGWIAPAVFLDGWTPPDGATECAGSVAGAVDAPSTRASAPNEGAHAGVLVHRTLPSIAGDPPC